MSAISSNSVPTRSTVADVELVRVPFDLLRDRGRGFGIAIDDRDDGTFVRERDGGGPSDTGATTGDDRDAALESVHATEATEGATKARRSGQCAQ